MEKYEGNRVKWLIDKPGGLFLTRRRRSLRREGEGMRICRLFEFQKNLLYLAYLQAQYIPDKNI